MKYRTIAFIGGGRITRAFLGGLVSSQTFEARIIVVEPDQGAREAMEKFLGNVALRKALSMTGPAKGAPLQLKFVNTPQECVDSDLIFLAIPSSAAQAVLENLKGALKEHSHSESIPADGALPEGAIVVSFIPKLSIARISAAPGGFSRIIRMNPSAPSLVGAGYNPVVFSDAVSERERSEFLEFIQTLGRSPITKEENLERYAMISAMGPTYLLFQLYELMDLGERFGLSNAEALEAVSIMAQGAARLISESGLPRTEVLDLIPSKPLAKDEDEIRAIYEKDLPPFYEKLKS